MNESKMVLIIEFDWPKNISKDLYQTVRKFHDLIVESNWIKEKVAASGGIGGDFSSIWVFGIENYAALDRFLHEENEISSAFNNWADQMVKMRISIKDIVQFI